MSQYKTGTATVTNGSATVTGTNTLWLANVTAGNSFTVAGDRVMYDVASVDSDTQITLSAPYAGTTASGVVYAIGTGFTVPDSFPEMSQGDIETATIFTRGMRKIQSKFIGIAIDKTKLDTVEDGATADQTKADIDALNIDADTLDGINSLGFDAAGAADTAVSDHVALPDPHSQYAEIAGQTFTGDIAAPGVTATGSFTSPGIDDNATSNAITIDSNENVGIGTDAPEAELHVEGVGLVTGDADSYKSEQIGLIFGRYGRTNPSTDRRHSISWSVSNYNDSENFVKFNLHTGSGIPFPPVTVMKLEGTGKVLPGSDNTQAIGSASLRWSEVFAGTGTINTSDAREKTPVRGMTKPEVSAAKDMGKEIGVYQFLASVEEKGDDARHHVGLTVQRAVEIMTAHGLEPFSYGFICFDEWDDVFVEHAGIEATDDTDAKAAWTEQTRKAGDLYGFRYDQLNLFIARGFESRLSALEDNA